ncbi:Cloroperoxidase [Mycena rebaudengoi]|nr:Cloroperoxidase [Mycena rebaudengoi]KAJ7252833.1 Cloroperoxidase [Mycena rebaudengoi]
MKLLVALFAAFATTALAFPPDSESTQDDHKWIPPKATDVRSPCPGLNTLANHGFLPRSGKKITIPMMLDAADKGFNMAAETILAASKFGMLCGNDVLTLDLDALNLHNLIEHDASLTRGDAALGPNLRFNETIFKTLAEANPGVDYYNATSAGQVQQKRLAISLATNPNITNTHKEAFIRSRESAFYLSIMGDPLTGVAPKKYVQTFFREERLPIAEGWKRPKHQITIATLVPIEDLVQKVSNWTPTQKCEDLVLGPDFVI